MKNLRKKKKERRRETETDLDISGLAVDKQIVTNQESNGSSKSKPKETQYSTKEPHMSKLLVDERDEDSRNDIKNLWALMKHKRQNGCHWWDQS